MTRRVVRAVLVGSVVFGLPGISVAAPRQQADPPPDPLVADVDGAAFAETFDAPEALDRFDWFVHNAANFNERPAVWHGDHDSHCGAPTSTRDVHFPDTGVGTHLSADRGELAYWCAPGGDGTGHFMTSFTTAGYGQIDFSPAGAFTDVSKVCWDQNLTQLGNRKWTQLAVISEERYVANDERLDYVKPQLQDGPGAEAIRLADDDFLLEYNMGGTNTFIGQDREELVSNAFDLYSNDDKAARFTTCVEDLENGSVRIDLERPTGVLERVQAGAFPDGPARVIFQDDSYNPPKSESPALVPDPFSWHWDNVVIDANASGFGDDAPASEPGAETSMSEEADTIIGSVWILAVLATIG